MSRLDRVALTVVGGLVLPLSIAGEQQKVGSIPYRILDCRSVQDAVLMSAILC
jgi:hypothetical protein